MRRYRYKAPDAPVPTDPVRQRILDAAAQLFAEQGFAATSLEQVIAHCEIGKDTLYRRFASKLELFEAMATRERASVDARFADFVEAQSGEPLAQLEAICRWLLAVNLEPRLIAFKRIAFSEAQIFGQSSQETQTEITDHMLGLVRALQMRGELIDLDPGRMIGHMINTLVLSPMMQAMLGDASVAQEEWQRAHFDDVWSLILGGLRPR